MSVASKIKAIDKVLVTGATYQPFFSKMRFRPLNSKKREQLEANRRRLIASQGKIVYVTKRPIIGPDPQKPEKEIFLGFETINPAYQHSIHGSLDNLKATA